MFHIVLYQPEIPQNTGNIARTCAVTGCKLHLIEPLGFSISDKQLKRSGLDYWDKVFVDSYKSFEQFLEENQPKRMAFLSTKGQRRYDEIAFQPGDYLVFGKETAGLPQEIRERYAQHLFRMPMRPGLRSLNLANTVCAIVYEGLRQNGFEGLV